MQRSKLILKGNYIPKSMKKKVRTLVMFSNQKKIQIKTTILQISKFRLKFSRSPKQLLKKKKKREH
jgi:hypothetical protein